MRICQPRAAGISLAKGGTAISLEKIEWHVGEGGGVLSLHIRDFPAGDGERRRIESVRCDGEDCDRFPVISREDFERYAHYHGYRIALELALGAQRSIALIDNFAGGGFRGAHVTLGPFLLVDE